MWRQRDAKGTYKNHPRPIPQQERRRCLTVTGLPSAMPYTDNSKHNVSQTTPKLHQVSKLSMKNTEEESHDRQFKTLILQICKSAHQIQQREATWNSMITMDVMRSGGIVNSRRRRRLRIIGNTLKRTVLMMMMMMLVNCFLSKSFAFIFFFCLTHLSSSSFFVSIVLSDSVEMESVAALKSFYFCFVF